MIEDWMASDDRVGALEVRHFFSGAAVYREETMVASLTPVGLAFKVPATTRGAMLEGEEAVPLRYFPNAPIKRDYVLFPEPEIEPTRAARLLIGERPTV